MTEIEDTDRCGVNGESRQAANEMWSMDFVSDALFDGRRLRALTVVEASTREALGIDVDQGIRGEQLVAAIARIALSRGTPMTIRADNGPEFISKASTAGHTKTAPFSTSAGGANQRTMPSWNCSTAAYETSA